MVVFGTPTEKQVTPSYQKHMFIKDTVYDCLIIM